MERIETDILIAGGGVAGLTAAAAFAARGLLASSASIRCRR